MKKYLVIFLFIFCLVLPAPSLADDKNVSDTNVQVIEKTVVPGDSKPSSVDDQDPLSGVTIKRFMKVDDVYYRGSRPNPEQYKELEDIGIKTVIDLRMNNKKKVAELEELLKKYNLKYVSIPLNPMKPPKQAEIDKFFSIIDNPEDTPVYVHCTHGQDRTGIMSALYRVEKFDWDYDRSYAEMKSIGYRSWLYRSLKKFLKKYANQKEAAVKASDVSK